MQLNAPGSLALSTFNLNVGSMAGNAPIDLGNQTLTVGSDNTSNTYSGIISDAGNLVKTGTGILALAQPIRIPARPALPAEPSCSAP